MENGKLTESAEMWQKGLKGLDGKLIAHGLEKCLESGEDWPPSLPKFRAMCLGSSEEQRENAAMYRPPECLALPKPRPRRDHARPYLQALRQALEGDSF
jgi:hypothetical protein